MKKKITFVVSYQLYPFDVLVSTDSLKNVLKYLKKRGCEVSKEEKQFLQMSGVGRTVLLNGNQTVIRLKKAPKTPFAIGSLSHEISHAVNFLFHRIGIKHGYKSEEAYAYAIGYLTEKILSKFEKRKNRANK